MSLRHLRHALALAAGIGASVSGVCATPAMAQTSRELTENYDSWQIKCVSDGGSGWSQCSMFQEFVQSENGNRLLVISFDRQSPALLTAVAPFGLMLENGMTLDVDGVSLGKGTFVICRTFGCILRKPLEEAQLASLKSGAEFSLVGVMDGGNNFVVTGSLAGFTAAHSRLQELATE